MFGGILGQDIMSHTKSERFTVWDVCSHLPTVIDMTLFYQYNSKWTSKTHLSVKWMGWKSTTPSPSPWFISRKEWDARFRYKTILAGLWKGSRSSVLWQMSVYQSVYVPISVDKLWAGWLPLLGAILGISLDVDCWIYLLESTHTTDGLGTSGIWICGI